MNTEKAIEKRRSIRKFKPTPLEPETLMELIRLGRLYASAVNAQPIRFAIITEKKARDTVFTSLKWAMRLHPYIIEEDERPTAYILLLGEEKESSFFEFDAGSAATTVMLAATSGGIANCCLKIPNPKELAGAFDFGKYVPYYAIALGIASVESHAVEMTDSLAYFLAENGDFRVPKRSTEEVLIYSDLK